MTRLRTAVVLLLGVLTAGCATTAPGSTAGASPAGATQPAVRAVASVDAWGSLLAQLGGARVATTSIVDSPDVDPHDYEPTPADARLIAGADVFLYNGLGYDTWAARAVAANPSPGREVVAVGSLLELPEGSNPHRWYSPPDVERVADALTAALKRADPDGAAYYDGQRRGLDEQSLAEYHQLIAELRSRFAGTPVGASESIFTPMAEALNLDLVTPASFLKAISEGTGPSAADKAAIDKQIESGAIRVYVENVQNSTPDVAAQAAAARARGIPVVEVTETPFPAGVSFSQWQTAQLRALRDALASSGG